MFKTILDFEYKRYVVGRMSNYISLRNVNGLTFGFVYKILYKNSKFSIAPCKQTRRNKVMFELLERSFGVMASSNEGDVIQDQESTNEMEWSMTENLSPSDENTSQDDYTQKMVSFYGDFDFSNTLTERDMHGEESVDPLLGNITIFGPNHPQATVTDSYIGKFVQEGFTLRTQVVKKSLEGDGKYKKIVQKNLTPVEVTKDLIRNFPDTLAAIQFKNNDKFVVLDLDSNKKGKSKEFLYKFILNLFQFYNWGTKSKTGPLVVETVRGFHLWFRIPLSFTVANKRDCIGQIGFEFELIREGFLAIAGLQRYVAFDQDLANLPVLPNLFKPVRKSFLREAWDPFYEPIPVGKRYNTLLGMINSYQINDLDVFYFIVNYLIEGSLEDGEINYLLKLLKQRIPGTEGNKSSVGEVQEDLSPRVLKDATYQSNLEAIYSKYKKNNNISDAYVTALNVYSLALTTDIKSLGSWMVDQYGKELGLARLVMVYLNFLNKSFAYSEELGSFIIYNLKKGIWETLSDNRTINYLQDFLSSLEDPALYTRAIIVKIIETLRGLIAIPRLPSIRGLATRKGFLSFQSGQLEEHSPHNYSLRFLNYNVYEQQELTPYIKEWFINLANGKFASLCHLRMALYITLTNVTDLNLGFYIYGEANSGKSTFIWLIKQLLGEENVYPITSTTYNSDFILQSLGTKSLILFEDFDVPELPRGVIDLIRQGLGGDDLSINKKSDPETRVRSGGVNIIFSGNSPVPLGLETEACSRRIVYVETGGYQSKFSGAYLRGELGKSLPAIMRWALKCPLEYFYIHTEAATLSVLHAEPAWCSITNFIYSQGEFIWLDPEFKTPLSRQSGRLEEPLYPNYKLFCKKKNIPERQTAPENRFLNIYIAILNRLAKRRVVRVEKKSGIEICGMKYMPDSSGATPDIEKGIIRLRRETAVINLLDPFSDILIPLYKLPEQLYQMLYTLKQAGCPGKIVFLEKSRILIVDPDEKGNVILPKAKGVLADSFQEAITDCPNFPIIKVNSAKDVLSLLESKSGDLPSESDNFTPTTEEEKIKFDAKDRIATDNLTVPLDIYRELLKHPLPETSIQQFKEIYYKDYDSWRSFFNQPENRGPKLKPSRPDGQDLILVDETLTSSIEEPYLVAVQGEIELENSGVELSSGEHIEIIPSSGQDGGIENTVNLGPKIGQLPSTDSIITVLLPDQLTTDEGKISEKTVINSSSIDTLEFNSLTPFSEYEVIPTEWAGMPQFTKTGNPKGPRPINYQARLLHRTLNVICSHVINNKSFCEISVNTPSVSLTVEHARNCNAILAFLEANGLIRWGENFNLSGVCVGMAFAGFNPSSFQGYEQSIHIPQAIYNYIPRRNTEIKDHDISRFLAVTRSHHANSIKNLPVKYWVYEDPKTFHYKKCSTGAETWEFLRKTLCERYSENPLVYAINSYAGEMLQTGFDLACLGLGITTEVKDGISKIKGTGKFYGKRCDMTAPFATSYSINPNDPGRFTVKGTNYLTYKTDHRAVLLRCLNSTPYLADYRVSSIDIKGCHLGIALSIMGEQNAPILSDLFLNKRDTWAEAAKYFPSNVPFYKKDLKAAFYAVLNGGNSDLAGIIRHISSAHEGRGEATSKAKIREIAKVVSTHPYLSELSTFQEFAKDRGETFYLPTSTIPVTKTAEQKDKEKGKKKGASTEVSAPYKNASPILNTWEFMFISRLIYEVFSLSASGKPIWFLQGMHDGFLILHHKDDNCGWLISHLNKVLGDYSIDCLGLKLSASLKEEG